MNVYIYTTFDIIDFAKNNNLAGLILLLRFEKAFDSEKPLLKKNLCFTLA